MKSLIYCSLALIYIIVALISSKVNIPLTIIFGTAALVMFGLALDRFVMGK